ncbi:MAG: AAA family ATPase, partial [Firmicutes bacterium]|nr:AAA family ATPase [Bacillota bacterium]
MRAIRLRGWRNYGDFEFTAHPGFNFVVGANAAGKTNLLEAVYYLCTGESWRAGREDELINWEAERAELIGLLVRDGSETRVAVHLDRSGKKTLTLGG